MFRLHHPILFLINVFSTIILTLTELVVSVSLASLFAVLAAPSGELGGSLSASLKNFSAFLGVNFHIFIITILLSSAAVRLGLTLFNIYFSGKYVFETYKSIVKLHLYNLVSCSYSKIKSTNVSSMVGIIDHESKLIANWFHLPLVVLTNELFLIAVFACFLAFQVSFAIFYFVFGTVFFVGVGGALIFLQNIYTRERKGLDRMILKHLDRYVTNLGNIRLSSNVQLFVNPILEKINLRKRSWIVHQGFSNLLRNVLETPIVVLVALLSVYALEHSSFVSIETITLMLLMFMRLSPSVSKIMSALSQIHYCIKNHSKDQIVDHESLVASGKVPTSVGLREGSQKIVSIALRDFSPVRNGIALIAPVNHEFSLGQVNLISGPSGVGKSSILECIAGLSTDYVGSIEYIYDNGAHSLRCGQGSVDLVFQNCIQYFEDPEKNIVWDSKSNPELVSELIEKFCLSDVFNRDSAQFKSLANLSDTISGGQNQRLSLARAIYSSKNILLFDEPTSALDSASKSRLIDELAITCGSSLVVVVTHDGDLLKSTESIYKNLRINGVVYGVD